MLRLASIDIGSNAMRLEIFEIKKKAIYSKKPFNIQNIQKSLKRLSNPGRVRIPVRLGYEAFSKGLFSDLKIEEAVNAFEYFKYEMIKNKVDFFLTSATSASRESVNGALLSKSIFERTGIRFRIIDGLKESQLINLALAGKYEHKNESDVLVDLGGGSLEINIREKGNVFYQDSLKLGTVRLLVESNFNEDKMVEIVDKRLIRIEKFLTKQKFIKKFSYYLTPGGNAEDLVDIAERFFNFKPRKKENMVELPLDLLEEILNLIKPVQPNLRAYRFNIRIDRADVIYQAGYIFKKIGEYANVDKMHIPRANLTDGILYDLIFRLNRMKNLGIDPYKSVLSFNNLVEKQPWIKGNLY